MHSEFSWGSIESGELVVTAGLWELGTQHISINPTWSDYQYRCLDMVPASCSLGCSVLLTASDMGVKISNV